MAIRFLYTGHGYGASFTSELFTIYDIAGTSLGEYFGAASRFPNTTSVGGGTFYARFGTATVNLIPFETDKKVFAAIDVFSRNESVNPDRWLIGFSDGRRVGNSSSGIAASNATEMFWSLITGTDGRLLLRIGGATVASSSESLIQGVFSRITVESVVAVAGYCKVYLNGELVIDYTGNTTNGLTNTNYRPRLFGSYTNFNTVAVWDTAGSSGFNSLYTDFIPVQILPDGAGSSTQGTPVGAASNFQCVDETFRNGNTDYVALDVATAQKDLYTYSAVGLAGNVISVIALPAAGLLTTGTARMKVETVSNGVPASTPSTIPLGKSGSSTYGTTTLPFELPVNPDTNAAWTVAEIDAAEFGVSATVS
jgi:hypothetical protein